jgi:hypothetical protein
MISTDPKRSSRSACAIASSTGRISVFSTMTSGFFTRHIGGRKGNPYNSGRVYVLTVTNLIMLVNINFVRLIPALRRMVCSNYA